jgi:hypothetical protein
MGNGQIEEIERSIGARVRNGSVSFTIPGGRTLVEQWHDVTTTSPTRVTLSVDRQGFRILISPPVLIDIQAPWSDIHWRGLRYEFATARFTNVDVRNTQGPAFDSEGIARGEITEHFEELLAGTRLARAGYNPATDTDLAGLLGEIGARFGGDASHGSVTTIDLRRVSASVGVTLQRDVRNMTPAGGVVIESGTTVTIRVHTSSSVASAVNAPRISSVHIDSSGINLIQGGEPRVRLTSLELERGRRVLVREWEALGDVRTAESAETTLRAFGLIFSAIVRTSGHEGATRALTEHGIRQGQANPSVVRGLTRSQLERALSEALSTALNEQVGAIRAGLPPNIYRAVASFFGLPAPPPPPRQRRRQHLPHMTR